MNNIQEVVTILPIGTKCPCNHDSSIQSHFLNKHSSLFLVNIVSDSKIGNSDPSEVSCYKKRTSQLTEKKLEEFLKIDFSFKTSEPDIFKFKAREVMKQKRKERNFLSKGKKVQF
jgi:hypothetical protein